MFSLKSRRSPCGVGLSREENNNLDNKGFQIDPHKGTEPTDSLCPLFFFFTLSLFLLCGTFIVRP